MFKKINFLLFLSLAILGTSCTKTPEAAFSTNKTAAEIDEVITFTNTSQDAVSYSWQFGDGSAVSTAESPTHAYAVAGSYTVTLTAYSEQEKKSNSVAKIITVNTESYRFTGSIDGTATNYNTSAINYGNYFTSGGAIGSPTSTKIFGSGIGDVDNNQKPSMHINLGTLTHSGFGIAPTADFFGFITAKTYPFSIGAASGVSITYTDITGEIWSTDIGSANQSGSSFVIATVEDVTSPFGNEKISFRALFNCKVYNASGSSKTITNGYYYAAFSNI